MYLVPHTVGVLRSDAPASLPHYMCLLFTNQSCRPGKGILGKLQSGEEVAPALGSGCWKSASGSAFSYGLNTTKMALLKFFRAGTARLHGKLLIGSVPRGHKLLSPVCRGSQSPLFWSWTVAAMENSGFCLPSSISVHSERFMSGLTSRGSYDFIAIDLPYLRYGKI